MVSAVAQRLRRLAHKWLESPLDPQAGWYGCYINVRCCGGRSNVLLILKDPLKLFMK